jgi:hypothetical protein
MLPIRFPSSTFWQAPQPMLGQILISLVQLGGNRETTAQALKLQDNLLADDEAL